MTVTQGTTQTSITTPHRIQSHTAYSRIGHHIKVMNVHWGLIQEGHYIHPTPPQYKNINYKHCIWCTRAPIRQLSHRILHMLQ
jgi:hypothetical protein